MTDMDNAAKVIHDLALSAAESEELQPGKIYCYLTQAGPQVVNLTGDEYLDMPKRKDSYPVVTDVASFAHYYTKHSDPASEVFADVDATRFNGGNVQIVAVLDAHTGGVARWQAHRLTLDLKPTPEWADWAAANTRMMNQAAFAEWIEDHIVDIAPDGPCDGAQLLDIAQQFQAHTKVNFTSGHRVSSGETKLIYAETIDARAGERGDITIPTAFELGIRIFADLDPYRVKTRFRYRINDGQLTLGYHLDQPERVVRDAATQILTQVSAACGGITVMLGTP